MAKTQDPVIAAVTETWLHLVGMNCVSSNFDFGDLLLCGGRGVDAGGVVRRSSGTNNGALVSRNGLSDRR